MDKEMLEQFQLLHQSMVHMEQEIKETRDGVAGLEAKIQESEARTTKRMQTLATQVNMKIENEVTKRIDALFDGYKLAHEKQWETERQTEQLKDQVADLQTRVAALEDNRTA